MWCLRHDANVIHLDFQGQGPFPADTTRAGAPPPSDDEPLRVDCGRHGRGVAAVVCGHLNESTEPQGFVITSEEPGDLQAWCDACEARFLVEGELNEAFRAFTRMSLVCEACWRDLALRHDRG